MNHFFYVFFKRFFDIVFGFLLLFLSAPVILISALLIRLETKGNPFFFQKRVGLRGKVFKIVKLRGMYSDAKKRYPELYDFRFKTDLNFFFHNKNDPRVTKIGSFIRRFSIDELPNFLNVIHGSMSLVGPRPEIPEVIALYGPYTDSYISVKPGITCLSKCSGRDALTKEESIKLDLIYIQKQSAVLDLKILYRTLIGVIFRKNVF